MYSSCNTTVSTICIDVIAIFVSVSRCDVAIHTVVSSMAGCYLSGSICFAVAMAWVQE